MKIRTLPLKYIIWKYFATIWASIRNPVFDTDFSWNSLGTLERRERENYNFRIHFKVKLFMYATEIPDFKEDLCIKRNKKYSFLYPTQQLIIILLSDVSK